MTDDTMWGGGFYKAHRVLSALNENPELLDRARQRFSRSPPSYRSDSGTPTELPSRDEPTEEERREEELFRREAARQASQPFDQFLAQQSEELDHILKADKEGMLKKPLGVDYSSTAYQNVRNRWIEQGIWRNEWYRMPRTSWKHEQPLELSSDPKPEYKLISTSNVAGRSENKSDEEIQRAAVLMREREASRPFHQFLFQMLKEQERIQQFLGVDASAADIGTQAYENVKNSWIKRKIWSKKWITIPGGAWKHEVPFDESDYIVLPPIQENGTRDTAVAHSPFERIPDRHAGPGESSGIPPSPKNQRQITNDDGSMANNIDHPRLEEPPCSPSPISRPNSVAEARGIPALERSLQKLGIPICQDQQPAATSPRPQKRKAIQELFQDTTTTTTTPRRSMRLQAAAIKQWQLGTTPKRKRIFEDNTKQQQNPALGKRLPKERGRATTSKRRGKDGI